jgi:hypothetical protein
MQPSPASRHFLHPILNSSVSIVTRLWDGRPGFDFWQGQGFFLLATTSRPALGPTNPPIQWVPGALSPEVKRPGREGHHLPPSSVEVKNAWSYTSSPPYVFMAWCLVKQGMSCRRGAWLTTGSALPATLPYPLLKHL